MGSALLAAFMIVLCAGFGAMACKLSAGQAERLAERRLAEVRELDATPTTPAGKIHGPGRYEVQGTFEAEGEPLVAPLANVPALWYRHTVYEVRWIRERRGGKTYLRQQETQTSQEDRCVPAWIRDESGAVRVDLGSGLPEGELVWDHLQGEVLERALVAGGLAYGGLLAVLGSLGLVSAAAREAFVAVVGFSLSLGLVGLVVAVPLYAMWMLAAPFLPARTRDRVWVLAPGSPGLVVADAVPLSDRGGVVLGKATAPMVISRELEEERCSRLVAEAGALEARADQAHMGAKLFVAGGGILATAAVLLALF